MLSFLFTVMSGVALALLPASLYPVYRSSVPAFMPGLMLTDEDTKRNRQ